MTCALDLLLTKASQGVHPLPELGYPATASPVTAAEPCRSPCPHAHRMTRQCSRRFIRLCWFRCACVFISFFAAFPLLASFSFHPGSICWFLTYLCRILRESALAAGRLREARVPLPLEWRRSWVRQPPSAAAFSQPRVRWLPLPRQRAPRRDPLPSPAACKAPLRVIAQPRPDARRLHARLHPPSRPSAWDSVLDLRVSVFRHFWKILLIVGPDVAFVSFLPRTPLGLCCALSGGLPSLSDVRGYFRGT